MQKWISPLRIFGRKNSFCSSVPNRMIVGPTVLIVSIGTGAPARIDSSNQMNCSTGVKPRPPYSLGPADAEPAVLAHLAHDLAHRGPDAAAADEARPHLGGEQLVVVGAHLLAELLLLLGQPDVHVGPPLWVDGELRSWNTLQTRRPTPKSARGGTAGGIR